MGLLGDAGQGLSRDIWAGTLGAPVDLATLIRNAGRAGYGTAGRATGLLSAGQMPDVLPPQPGGSASIANWMRANGLLADNPGSTGDTIGSLAAGLLPFAGSPRVASAAIRAGENLAVPRTLNPQRGMMDLNSLDDLMRGPSGPPKGLLDNGSREGGAASAEGIARLASDKAAGRFTVLRRADGTEMPLNTVDAADWKPGPGESVWQLGVGADPTKWVAMSQGKGARLVPPKGTINP